MTAGEKRVPACSPGHKGVGDAARVPSWRHEVNCAEEVPSLVVSAFGRGSHGRTRQRPALAVAMATVLVRESDRAVAE